MDINLSANTLFHFTPNKENLLSILKNGIYIRYSLENYDGLVDEGQDREVVLPMACFCDIPLSQVKRHTEIYGRYAIGLTKKWGMTNKINPVIYTYNNSSIANILDEIHKNIESFIDIDSNFGEMDEGKPIDDEKLQEGFKKIKDIYSDDENSIYSKTLEVTEELGHFAKYIKPYEGKLYRTDGYVKKLVRFYEEREWRFVPPRKILKEINVKDSYKPEFYKNQVKKRYMNMRLAGKIKLDFSSNDIRFIIVHKESEIPDTLKYIEEIFENAISAKALKLLGTRLISMEQIMEDL